MVSLSAASLWNHTFHSSKLSIMSFFPRFLALTKSQVETTVFMKWSMSSE